MRDAILKTLVLGGAACVAITEIFSLFGQFARAGVITGMDRHRRGSLRHNPTEMNRWRQHYLVCVANRSGVVSLRWTRRCLKYVPGSAQRSR